MWMTLLLGAVLGFLAVVILTFFTRGTPIKDARLAGDGIAELAAGQPLFRETFSILTGASLCEGNRVEILTNGDGTYSRLWEDLAAARELITWHVFWFKPGRLADRLAEILIERRRAGVEVLFLYDYYGTWGVRSGYFDRLREGGIEVVAFRPPRWNTLYKIQQRMHVRAVVIDGRVGYTGGFAIADEWLGDGRHSGQWRDTSVRLQGAIVNQLQAVFASNWTEATGELIVGDKAFPLGDGEPPGDTRAGILHAAPSLGSTNAERFFMLTIHGARDQLYITNAYFVPDQYFREALIDAVGRGVDVRVLTPGRNTDRISTFHAARAHYEELIEGGVRLYHYRPTMVHAKTLVADGIWSTVGTMNFDNRSMVLNDEAAAVIEDPDCAAELERRFLEDLEHADEVRLEEVRARGWIDRIRERVYVALSPVL